VFEEGTFVPAVKIVNNEYYNIISDYLGTPNQAYRNDGELVWERELNSYGATRDEKGLANFIPFKYQGQYYDNETGLAYNRFRYYDPGTGNYISQDPIRLAGDNPTIYGYVKDTNTWLDICGLDCHHIATNKDKYWKDRFRKLFKKYGFGKFKNGKERADVLNDPRNIVNVPGHKGPHNEAGFHEGIYNRLDVAGKTGSNAGFETELATMKIECTTSGSDMNKIITKTY
jgi:RHS repeat-associated protein